MKKWFAILIALSILSACGNEATDREAPTQENTDQTSTSEPASTTPPAQPATSSKEIPEGYPDLPIAEGAVITNTMNVGFEKTDQYIIAYQVEKPFAEVVALYKDYLAENRFNEIFKAERDNSYTSQNKVDKVELYVEVRPGSTEGVFTVILTYNLAK